MACTEENKTERTAEGNGVRLKKPDNLPRINLRPFLFVALGLIFGIILYTKIRLGSAKGTDFVFFVLLLAFSLRPLSLKRLGAIFLCFATAAGAGAGLIHFKCENYLSGVLPGEYRVTGTVVSFTVGDGSSSLVLDDLLIGGNSADGKLSVTVSSEACLLYTSDAADD